MQFKEPVFGAMRNLQQKRNDWRVIEEGEGGRRFKEFKTESATLKAELTAVELEISILFVPINNELKRLKKQDET